MQGMYLDPLPTVTAAVSETSIGCPAVLLLQWGVHAGRSWELIEGLDQGQTQVDLPQSGDMALWAHPVDVHYVCRGLLGWPKLHFQIWSQDVHGRNELSKFASLPRHNWELQLLRFPL